MTDATPEKLRLAAELIWSTEIDFAIHPKFTLVLPWDLGVCREVGSLKTFSGGNLWFAFRCFDYGAHFRSSTIKPVHTPANPIEDELLWNIVLNGLCGDEGFGYEYLMIDNFYPNLRQARDVERLITAHFLPFPIECE